ncbi:MAG: beta-N-acetylhexosaminidase [Pseudomonadota bacterium]
MTDEPRACILSLSGPDLPGSEARFLAEANPWGIILMGRSCVSRSQVRRLLADVWSALGRECPVFIDQEGGRVARLRPPEWPAFPAPSIFGRLYTSDPHGAVEAARLSHHLMAAELSDIGIGVACAPVLDMPAENASDVVGDRAFADTPDAVIALARAAIEGLALGGVAPVIKHMPGHGRALVDSHDALPQVEAPEDVLATHDFLPFQALRDAPMGMTAHIAFTTLDADTAATVSSKVIEETIRKRIGFQGLLMTDDLGMNALGGALAGRARRALGAGCDIVLHCAGFVKERAEIVAEMAEVAGACPPLAGESRLRAERASAFAGPATELDRGRARAELGAALSGLEAKV